MVALVQFLNTSPYPWSSLRGEVVIARSETTKQPSGNTRAQRAYSFFKDPVLFLQNSHLYWVASSLALLAMTPCLENLLLVVFPCAEREMP